MLYPTRPATAQLYGISPKQWNPLPKRVCSLCQIDLDLLQALDVRGVILEIDRGHAPSESMLTGSERLWLNQARALGIQLCALAETGDPRHHWSHALDIPCADTSHRPLFWVLQHVMSQLQLGPRQVVVLSDRQPTSWLDTWLVGCLRVQLVQA